MESVTKKPIEILKGFVHCLGHFLKCVNGCLKLLGFNHGTVEIVYNEILERKAFLPSCAQTFVHWKLYSLNHSTILGTDCYIPVFVNMLLHTQDNNQEIPRNLACFFIAESVASDQTKQVRRLGFSYTGRICHKTNFHMTRM